MAFLAKYKLYFLAGVAFVAILAIAVFSAYMVGYTKGHSKAEIACKDGQIASYSHTIEQIQGWAEQDAADRARWAAENKETDSQTQEGINRILDELGDISDAEPITIEGPSNCYISYSAVRMRNKAAAATGYRARTESEASAFGFDLEVPTPSSNANPRGTVEANE